MQVKIIVQALADSLSKLKHYEQEWVTISLQNLESVSPAHRLWPFMLIYRDSLLYAVAEFSGYVA